METASVKITKKKKSFKIKRSSGNSFFTIHLESLGKLTTSDESKNTVHTVGKPVSARQTHLTDCVILPEIEVSNNGGMIITNPVVHLVFWGIDWYYATNPSVVKVIHAVEEIIDSNYTDALDQYGINKPILSSEITLIGDSDPNQGFSMNDVGNLIQSLINKKTFPAPNNGGENNLFMVIMPPGVIFEDQYAGGAHGYVNISNPYSPYPDPRNNAWFGWVRYGQLKFVARAFSHELVEACTDPESNGFQIYLNQSQAQKLALGDEGLYEIGDVCRCVDSLGDILVNPYWSQRDRDCIAPQPKIIIPGTTVADVVVDAQFRIEDEQLFGSTPCDFHLTHTILLNNENKSVQFVLPTPIVGRESRVELICNIEMNPDYSVMIDYTAKLYDGSDIDDSYSGKIFLEIDRLQHTIVDLRSDELNSDTAHIDISFTNTKRRIVLPIENNLFQ